MSDLMRSREADFSFVEYRDSFIGRQPYLKGSGLSIWEVIMIARDYNFDAERMAQEYHQPVEAISAALQFYKAYRTEIDQAIEDNNIGYDTMKRQLPNLKLLSVPIQGASRA